MNNDQELTFYLKNIVSTLANRIGERNIQHYDKLIEAQKFLTMTFQSAGYSPRLQTYVVDNKYCSNIEVEQAGRLFPEKIIVIGAHYDSVGGCPGANDNASGVAEVLALAEFFKVHPLKRTVRFLLFVNEEPPFTRTTEMGSVQYAKACKERHEQIEAMLSIETVGYFPSEAKQERIEPWFYKKLSYSEKDFIAFVSNLSSRRLLKNIRRFFQQRLDIPSKYLALPGFLPGVKSSGHWSFWKQGYQAVMVTDTAWARYPFYHTREDTPEKLSFSKMAQLYKGLERVIGELGNKSER